MALSQEARDRLVIALTSRSAGNEVADAIESGSNSAAASVAALGSTTNIPTVSVTLSTSNTYSDAAVKTAIDAGANAVRTAAEARLDAAEAKIDAVIAALKAAGLMSA